VNRTELLKKLAAIGDLELVREGANHTIFRVKGSTVSVPRHREINEITARAIIRDAEGRRK
jgi:mRNA interferase HicA